MGRTKNPNPRKRVVGAIDVGFSEQASLAVIYEPSSIRQEHVEEVGKEDKDVVEVAIGPGRSLSIEMPKKHRKKTVKRRRMIIEESDDEEEGKESEQLEHPIEIKIQDDDLVIRPMERRNDHALFQVLKTVELGIIPVVVRREDDEKPKLLMEPYDVISLEGAKVLLSFLFPNTPDGNDETALAVDDGTLTLQIMKNSVAIGLTRHAVHHVCSPKHLPFGVSRGQKKYRPALTLQRALGFLANSQPLLDAVKTERKTTAPPITAKTVYKCTDNVQLERYEKDGGYDCKPMQIEGLVPQLRPYQEAAVKWMLRRESGHTHDREWELVWHVVTTNLHIMPLVEWRVSRTQVEDSEDFICLFSPYSGWIAETLEVARASVVGDEYSPVLGGILADGMGMGKTVSLLACILANKHSNAPLAANIKPGSQDGSGAGNRCPRVADIGSTEGVSIVDREERQASDVITALPVTRTKEPVGLKRDEDYHSSSSIDSEEQEWVDTEEMAPSTPTKRSRERDTILSDKNTDGIARSNATKSCNPIENKEATGIHDT